MEKEILCVRIRAGKIDQTLKELLVGILLFGVFVTGIGIWFVNPRGSFLIGLVAGMGLAVFWAVHMYRTIDRNLEINRDQEGAANSYATKSSLIRYGVATMVLLGCGLLDVTCFMSAFLGIMGLKIGAYLQPFTHKYIFRNKEEDIEKVG